MKPNAPCTAFAALLLAWPCPHLAGQSAGSPIRRIADIHTKDIYGIAEPASGRFLAYATVREIHILDERTGKVAATLDSTIAVNHPSWYGNSLSISASGRRLVFLASGEAKGKAYVWSVDLDSMSGKPSSAPHRVSIMPADGATISDDGRWIAVVTSDDPKGSAPPMRKLLVIPSDGGDERVLDTEGRIEAPRWTPDGKTIYYIRGRGHGPALARIAVSGGKPDSLAPATAIVGVSPDGRRVAYYPTTNGTRAALVIGDLQGRPTGRVVVQTNDLFRVWSRHEPATILGARDLQATTFKTISLDNGKVSPFAVSDSLAIMPRFSPNGRQLAATSMVDNRMQFAVFDLATRQRRILRTGVEPDGWGMQWSPDGTRIAFKALDSSLARHELYVVDVATSRATRLADLGPTRGSNATLFRWRSDGQSIDYISGTDPHGAVASLERVTLSGNRSVISKLPAVPHGQGTTGGYRFLDDTLIAIGRDYSKSAPDSSFLAIIDARTGATRARVSRFAFWNMSNNASIKSPDGKWVAFGSGGRKDNQTRPQAAIVSLDGKTVRLLGEPMMCDAWPEEWLPDSRSLIVAGVPSCDQYHIEHYVVPIDGGPARHLSVPNDFGLTLTRDGRSLLAAVLEPRWTNFIAIDVTKAIGTRAPDSGKPRQAGRN